MVKVEYKEIKEYHPRGFGSFWFETCGNIYRLSYTGDSRCALVNIDEGRAWNYGAKVDDINNITEAEWDTIKSNGTFTPIKSGTITINISEDKD